MMLNLIDQMYLYLHRMLWFIINKTIYFLNNSKMDSSNNLIQQIYKKANLTTAK